MERMADGLTELAGRLPVIKELQQEKELAWINPDRTDYGKSMEGSELTMADVEDAEARLWRFAPFIMRCFPETKEKNGLVESALTPIPRMQAHLNRKYGSDLKGRLLLKQPGHEHRHHERGGGLPSHRTHVCRCKAV